MNRAEYKREHYWRNRDRYVAHKAAVRAACRDANDFDLVDAEEQRALRAKWLEYFGTDGGTDGLAQTTTRDFVALVGVYALQRGPVGGAHRSR